MTRQQDILDGLDNLFSAGMLTPSSVLDFLDEKGAVLKVEKELPEPLVKLAGNYKTGYLTCRWDMKQLGFTPTERLKGN